MWFVTLILRNLWHRKVRSLLTAFGMGIAVCTVVTLFGVIDVYEGAVTQMYQTRDVDLIVARAGVAQVLLGRLNQDLAAKLRDLSGVKSVELMLLDLVSFKEPKLEAVYVMGWDPAGTMFDHQIKAVEGRFLKKEDSDKLILGIGLAKSLKTKVGEKIAIEDSELEVVGVYESGNLFQDNAAIVPLLDLQELMQQPNKVTMFLVRVADGPDKEARVGALSQEIELIRDDSNRQIMSATSTAKHVSSALELRVIKTMSFTTSFIALFIGVIGMLNTMMISVFERTREIGTLRAVGWPQRRVMIMIVLETLILAALGALLGLVMSMLLTWFLSNFMQGSGVKIPSLPTVTVVVQALLLAMGVGLAGALYPAYRASHLQPTEALRHD